jgi:hypothetical protein
LYSYSDPILDGLEKYLDVPTVVPLDWLLLLLLLWKVSPWVYFDHHGLVSQMVSVNEWEWHPPKRVWWFHPHHHHHFLHYYSHSDWIVFATRGMAKDLTKMVVAVASWRMLDPVDAMMNQHCDSSLRKMVHRSCYVSDDASSEVFDPHHPHPRCSLCFVRVHYYYSVLSLLDCSEKTRTIQWYNLGVHTLPDDDEDDDGTTTSQKKMDVVGMDAAKATRSVGEVHP